VQRSGLRSVMPMARFTSGAARPSGGRSDRFRRKGVLFRFWCFQLLIVQGRDTLPFVAPALSPLHTFRKWFGSCGYAVLDLRHLLTIVFFVVKAAVLIRVCDFSMKIKGVSTEFKITSVLSGRPSWRSLQRLHLEWNLWCSLERMALKTRKRMAALALFLPVHFFGVMYAVFLRESFLPKLMAS
jgi:hypothetical protein